MNLIKHKEGVDFVDRTAVEKIWGENPSFMKINPMEVLVHEWASRGRVGEIDIERARYLLNTDEELEEILNKIN